MSSFAPTVEDLALYFADDDGKIAACWVKREVYLRTAIPQKKEWEKATLLEDEDDQAGIFYVLNLSRMIEPGASPVPPQFPAPVGGAAPGAKDLVIIPHDSPKTALLVPRAVYTDVNTCPRIARSEDTADLDFLALNQGVVVANLPKYSAPYGWTCFLLSLLSLRSGALPGLGTKNKNEYFGTLTGG
jgi:hypothetical protein